MKLYHFCSKIHIDNIKSEGLTKGSIPIIGTSGQVEQLARPFQWLTRNKDWQQEWADNEFSQLPYSRTDYRIEVKIPKDHRDKLKRWVFLCISMERLILTRRILNAYGDPDSWYVFNGRIKPSWFREIKQHPYKVFDRMG